MKPAVVTAMLLALLFSACSWEGAKRTTYETVESMRIQQCLDRRDDPDCPAARQRYDGYRTQQQSGVRK